MKNGNRKVCPFAEEIVSYIYGEIDGAAESDFETHLADCTVCTDEFAAVSNSRFSVYEWKTEAFDPLPTPEIIIPYPSMKEEISVGFLVAVRAWAGQLRMPVAIAAVLAVCIGLGFIILSNFGKGEQKVANKVEAPALQPDRQPDVVQRASVPQGDTAEPKRTLTSTSKPLPASTIPQKRFAKRSLSDLNKQENAIQRNRTLQLQKAPVLTAYQEADDDSLRLADLFDEVGG
jgi:hypothetical protein